MAGLRRNAVQFTYLALLLLQAPGCTTRSATPIDSARPGDRIATIPAARVDVLTIVKADPVSGDRWSAELRRAHPEALPAFQWELSTEAPRPDTRADGDLIRHILDSLEALKIAAVPRPSPLEAAGLKPPRFALRWAAGQGTEELHLGAQAAEPGQVYAMIPVLSSSRPVKVQGSLMGVLASLDAFDRLRQRNWANMEHDDFDEIELRRRGKTILYAQRDRDSWTDKNHSPVKKDAARILRSLVSSSIREFIDEPKLAQTTASSLARTREYEAILTDRAGQAIRLTLSGKGQGRLIQALVSTRPEAPFRLDRAILEAWDF